MSKMQNNNKKNLLIFSDQHSAGLVFGIPLTKCIANDTDLQRKRNSGSLKERRDSSDVILHRQPDRKPSVSSQGSEDNILSHNGTSFTEGQKVGYKCSSYLNTKLLTVEPYYHINSYRRLFNTFAKSWRLSKGLSMFHQLQYLYFVT